MTIRVSKRVEMDGKTVDMTVEAEFPQCSAMSEWPELQPESTLAQERASALFQSMDFPLNP